MDEVQVGAERIMHKLSVIKSGISSGALLLDTFVDVRGETNYEMVMQLHTDVQNHRTLFTDMNGLTITKKVYYEKLTIQGNVYPIVSSAFIQGAIMEETFLF